jgi:hypothetical protein
MNWKKRAFTSSSGAILLLTGLAPTFGEAEVIRDRLKQHKTKEFWVSAIVFVSKDENLTKAHFEVS